MGLEDEKMIQTSEQDRTEFLRLVSDNKNDWESCKNQKGISVFRCPVPKHDETSHRRAHVFKGETIVEASLDDLATLIHPSAPYRLKWDDHLLGVDIIKRLNQNTILVKHLAKPQLLGLIGKRDSVDLLYVDSLGSGNKMISFSSTEYSECPPDENYVRAWTFPSGVILDETETPNQTRVRAVFQVDFNMPNLVPLSLIDATMPKELLHFLQKYRDAPKTLTIPEDSKPQDLPGWD